MLESKASARLVELTLSARSLFRFILFKLEGCPRRGEAFESVESVPVACAS